MVSKSRSFLFATPCIIIFCCVPETHIKGYFSLANCINRKHTHKGRKYSLQESNEKGQRSPSIDVTHRKVSIQPEDAELEVLYFSFSSTYPRILMIF